MKLFNTKNYTTMMKVIVFKDNLKFDKNLNKNVVERVEMFDGLVTEIREFTTHRTAFLDREVAGLLSVGIEPKAVFVDNDDMLAFSYEVGRMVDDCHTGRIRMTWFINKK